MTKTTAEARLAGVTISRKLEGSADGIETVTYADLTDEARFQYANGMYLAAALPGFKNIYSEVNGSISAHNSLQKTTRRAHYALSVCVYNIISHKIAI